MLPPQVPRSAAGVRLRTAVVTTQASTTTSTASGIEAGARGRAMERSSPRGSRDQSSHGRRPRSSTRGSRKRRRGIISQNPMDDLDNYVPSGWKMDLLHIVVCHYAHQIGPLTNERWKKDSKAFLQTMKLRREKEWLAIKELEPLDYMSYVAAVFKQVTGHYLKGLSGYTGWMRAGGYYHWKAAELNQLDCCPHLRGIPVHKGPMAQPRTRQQPPRPQQAQQLCQSDEPEAQTSASGGHRGEQLPTLMELDDLPQAEAGAGDPSSWYNRSVQEEEWREANKNLAAEVERLQEALGRPSSSTVAPGSARPKELKVIYKHVATREWPRGNIASPAIQAFYPTLHHGQWRTLSSQALTMISEYHTACVINGSSTTSPIPSQEIEEKLPPLADYTRPAGTGITDVRVWDNKAKSLRVAVWLHWLDMSLSQEKDASRSLVPSRHTQGCLLGYFLAPGTSNLSYGEVLTQVIEENHMELRRMREHLTSSLLDCNAKRTKYLDELTCPRSWIPLGLTG